mmetsp:Transcript_8429/g.28286  ORF Transcript_8429/g.28286 Transcript_8429/m.28286 type:complete len:1016 (-) Transcript_8429:107-3154(-)
MQAGQGGQSLQWSASSSQPLPFRRWRSNPALNQDGASPASLNDYATGCDVKEDEEDRASILSLDSDSTSGPFFWYRVIAKHFPKARNCHTATMVGDKMLVFGGFGGSKWFEELWVFDTPSIEWHKPELQSSAMEGSPSARYAHTAVSFRGLLYVFGGYGGGDGWLGDLWVLDTQAIRVRDQSKVTMAWLSPNTSGTPPPPRAAHTANIVGSKMYIFGGNNGSYRMNDFYSLDTQTMVWRKEICKGDIPKPRAGHTMTCLSSESSNDDEKSQLLLFAGGDVTDVYNDMYIIDVDCMEWREVATSGPRPSPRAGHCAAALPDGNVLVWGGGSVGRLHNDLHLLQVKTMQWTGSIDLKMSPEPRVGHSLCMWGTEMYIFGGGDSQSVFGDLCILDTEALLQSDTYTGNLYSSSASREHSPSTKALSHPEFELRLSGQTSLSSLEQLSPDQGQVEDFGSEEGTREVEENRAKSKAVDQVAGGDRETGKVCQDGASKDVGNHLNEPGKTSASSDASRQRGQNSLASLPQRTLNSLEDKLKNRPSKEDLVQQNILKASTAVTPNILAAQQRLLMRQMGSTLERKLRSRPQIRQLVLHNIIPEEDVYEDHEHRLWGHIQSFHGSMPEFAKNQNRRDLKVAYGREGLASVIDCMQSNLMERLGAIRQGIDSLRLARTRVTSMADSGELKERSEEEEECLEHHVRSQIRLAENSCLEYLQIVRTELAREAHVSSGAEKAACGSAQATDKKPDERETSVPLPPPVPSSSTSPQKQDADSARQDQGGREEERRAAGGATKEDKCSEDQQEERGVNPSQVNPPKSMMKQIYNNQLQSLEKEAEGLREHLAVKELALRILQEDHCRYCFHSFYAEHLRGDDSARSASEQGPQEQVRAERPGRAVPRSAVIALLPKCYLCQSCAERMSQGNEGKDMPWKKTRRAGRTNATGRRNRRAAQESQGGNSRPSSATPEDSGDEIFASESSSARRAREQASGKQERTVPEEFFVGSDVELEHCATECFKSLAIH